MAYVEELAVVDQISAALAPLNRLLFLTQGRQR
jgi:hypothetical protein